MTTTYDLYYCPGVCSLAVHALLIELGQKVNLHKIDLRAPRDPEFLKISPRGQVPALVENGISVTEGGAILVYLCDKHKSDLLPSEGISRAKALEALMFCNATLHPAASNVFGSLRIEDVQTKETALKAHFARLQSLWDFVETRLDAQKYLAGDKVTIGDVLLAVIANWSYDGKRPNFGPKTTKLLAEISTRPSYQAAMQAEGVEYKAAA